MPAQSGVDKPRPPCAPSPGWRCHWSESTAAHGGRPRRPARGCSRNRRAAGGRRPMRAEWFGKDSERPEDGAALAERDVEVGRRLGHRREGNLSTARACSWASPNISPNVARTTAIPLLVWNGVAVPTMSGASSPPGSRNARGLSPTCRRDRARRRHGPSGPDPPGPWSHVPARRRRRLRRSSPRPSGRAQSRL